MKKLFFILFLFFFGANHFGQSNELLKALQSKFNSLKDFSVDFQQISGANILLSGKFFFKQKRKTRIEMRDLILATDGATTYSFNNKTKKLIVSNYDDSDPSMISLEAIINKYPDKCAITESKEKKTITIVPKDASLNFKQVKLFVGDESLISKIEVTNFDDQQLMMTFGAYKLNNGLTENLFTLTPTSETKVIDLR